MLTDYLLGGWALVLGNRLRRAGAANGHRVPALWGGAFAVLGMAAFSGGTYHGVAPACGDLWLRLTWKVAGYCTGAASLLLLAAAIRSAVTNHVAGRAAIALVAVQAGVYALWMMDHDDFLYVIINYASALVIVMVLQLHAWWSRGEPGSRWVIGGIAVSLAGAAIQHSGFNVHAYFNHNDLYHVIQMGALYLLFRGGLLLRP